MKRKSILIIVGLTVILLILMGYYFADVCSREENFMAKIRFREKMIEIRFIQAGATTRDVVQIMSISEKGKKRILKNIENNNFLMGYYVINDSTLGIMVNKMGRFVNKPDTLEIVVPD